MPRQTCPAAGAHVKYAASEFPEPSDLVAWINRETIQDSVARMFARVRHGERGPGRESRATRKGQQAQTTMSDPVIAPHGGALVCALVPEAERALVQAQARTLPQIALHARQLADLQMLAVGAYSPLDGFMRRADYLSVLRQMHLQNGLPWSLPITLAVSRAQAASVREGAQVALTDGAGCLQAVLTVEEIYGYDKQLEAEQVYRTTDEAHPGVTLLYQQGEFLLGGRVQVLALPAPAFPRYDHSPARARQLFRERGWRRVVGFQTRNPVHRAHEYLQKCALETMDGLYLHPLVGETKSDDIPASVRMQCYETLLAHYYPPERVLLGVLPAAMRYAGPREAVFHALIRKNYGCSHFIVGRDHAGVGHYYGSYDAQSIFLEFDSGAMGITPLFFDNAFFCRVCGTMASARTCPHEGSSHVVLSGTAVRQMLQRGELPPREFSRPEVARILLEAMRAPQRESTGLVGEGEIEGKRVR
jgi:sulfate adenylyltransferase